MRWAAIILVTLCPAVAYAWTHGVAVQPPGKVLLVDGVSFLLLTDGTSKLCRAGGC